MVLRLIVLVLTVANLAYFGWSEGWLDGVLGPRSTGEREPSRADAQVRPELMVLSDGKGTITAGLAPASAASPASMATVAASAASAPATGRVSASASAALASGNGSTTGAAESSPPGSPPAAPSTAASAAPAQPTAAHGAAASAQSAVASSPRAATGSLSAATSGASSPPAPAASGTAAHTASASASATAGAVTSPASSAATGNACVQSGPYAAKDAAAVESAFKTVLPVGGWTRVSADKPGVWMIYMGRFADNEARRKKEGELSRRNATFEEVEAPAEFAKGLSLGRFASRADAEKGLADLNKLGVHTARIVTFTAPVQASLLRADKLDAATADKLKALRTPMPVVACEP